MDLTNAFDTVDHKILLHKMEMAGLRGIALRLFTSYLTDRRIVVDANGVVNDTREIGIGIPQGSVCGPLMFVISSH